MFPQFPARDAGGHMGPPLQMGKGASDFPYKSSQNTRRFYCNHNPSTGSVFVLDIPSALLSTPHRISIFSTSLGLIVNIRDTPCSFVLASCASFASPCRAKLSRSAARPLPTRPAALGSGGGPACRSREYPLYRIFNSFSTSLRLMVNIRETPCSCMVTP